MAAFNAAADAAAAVFDEEVMGAVPPAAGAVPFRAPHTALPSATATGAAAADHSEVVVVGRRLYTDFQLWLQQVVYAPKVHTSDVESCFNIIDVKCPGAPTMDHVSLTCICHFGKVDKWAATLPDGCITRCLITQRATARGMRRKTEVQEAEERMLAHNVKCSRISKKASAAAFVSQHPGVPKRKRRSLENVPVEERHSCGCCGSQFILKKSLNNHRKNCFGTLKVQHPRLFKATGTL